MSLVAFQKLLLLEILRPAISVNLVQSRNSVPDSDPIYPELIMHIGLWWLDVGAYAHICDTTGISTTSVYRCRDLFMDAVLTVDEIAINLPQTAA